MITKQTQRGAYAKSALLCLWLEKKISISCFEMQRGGGGAGMMYQFFSIHHNDFNFVKLNFGENEIIVKRCIVFNQKLRNFRRW